MKKDDDLIRMLVVLNKIDPNERFADLQQTAMKITRELSDPRTKFERRASLADALDKIERKMRYWKARPRFDTNEVARLRYKAARRAFA